MKNLFKYLARIAAIGLFVFGLSVLFGIGNITYADDIGVGCSGEDCVNRDGVNTQKQTCCAFESNYSGKDTYHDKPTDPLP